MPTTWMNLKNMLNETSQTQNIIQKKYNCSSESTGELFYKAFFGMVYGLQAEVDIKLESGQII